MLIESKVLCLGIAVWIGLTAIHVVRVGRTLRKGA